MRSNSGHGWIYVARAARRGIVFGLMVSAWTLAGVARGQSIAGEFPVPTAGVSPSMIVAGPDGNLWFTESTRSQIGQITPNGVVTEFPTSRSAATAITVGSDHNLWFTQGFSASIGRMTTQGDVEHFSVPTPASTGLFGITAGPDDALWFTEFNANKIGRITTNGQIRESSTSRAHSPAIQIFRPPAGLRPSWPARTAISGSRKPTPT